MTLVNGAKTGGTGSTGQPGALGCNLCEVGGYRTILSKGVTLCNYRRKDQINGHKRVSWLSESWKKKVKIN